MHFWNLGSFEEHELFSEVLLGIKNVIQSHLRDVQNKFEDQFQSLDVEIRNRDVLIYQLQHRIQELENDHVSPINPIAATSGTGNGSTGSSGDIPFVVRKQTHFDILTVQFRESFCQTKCIFIF